MDSNLIRWDVVRGKADFAALCEVPGSLLRTIGNTLICSL
jgi:hypothetical protein